MSIIAHAGHDHGIDPALITFMILALVLGSVAAMATVRAWQQRSDSEVHSRADVADDSR